MNIVDKINYVNTLIDKINELLNEVNGVLSVAEDCIRRGDLVMAEHYNQRAEELTQRIALMRNTAEMVNNQARAEATKAINSGQTMFSATIH